MKTFLAVYTGTPEKLAAWKQLGEEERTKLEIAGIESWMAWGEQHAASIVDQGTPLGKTKRAAADGISDVRNNISGYVIVRAESHDEAARLFEDHPHFTIFPGEAVEIMECLQPPPR